MRAFLLVATLGLTAPNVAEAQQVPSRVAIASTSQTQPSTGESIVVTGKSAPHRAKVRALTDAVTPVPLWGEPLARFESPLCIGTAGLDRQTLEQIGQRLAWDAVRAGLSLGGTSCTPNVLILFVNAPSVEIDRLRKSSPGLFGDRTPTEIASLKHEPGPVHAWQNTEIRSTEGEPLSFQRVLPVRVASIITTPIQRNVLSAVVVVQRSAALGKTAEQLGDYLAMRVLAGVRPQRAQGKETILTLFDADNSPPLAEMTAFDQGYLQGLYAGAPNTKASTTKKMIVRSILAAEEKQATGAK